MGTNILQAINELTTAIQGLQTQINVYNQNDVSPICCDTAPTFYDVDLITFTQGQGDPPAPYPDWPTWQTDFCQRAYTAVRLENKAMDQLWDIADIATSSITIGVLLAILAIVSAPWAVAAAILAMLTTGVFEVSIVLMKNALDALEDTLVCAIFNAETPTIAKANIDTVLDASSLDALSIAILKQSWHNGIINNVFDGTLAADPNAPDDCTFCVPPEPGDLFETAHSAPYNVAIKGTITNFATQDPSYGWEAQNSGNELAIEWTQVGQVNQWQFSFQARTRDLPPGANYTPLVHLYQWSTGTQSWQPVTGGFWQFSIPRNTWTAFQQTPINITLWNNFLYRIQFDLQEFNEFLRYRDINSHILSP